MAIKKLTTKQQGFALIFVLVFIAMIMGIVGDIVYQTQLTAKNTIVQEDQVFAKTAARTGIEFAKLLLTLNKLAANYQNNPLLPIPKNLYSVLNGQPIGAESFQQIEGLTGINFSELISPELLNGLKAMKGYFVLNITSENAKFNLNLLQSTYSNTAQKALLRIFSSPDSGKFLELYNYTPQQLADNLTDYIKISVTDGALDLRVMSDFNRLGLKYLPKHAALESLEELRRIPGFEIDDIYNMFAPYFTIWPISGPQNSLNINAAPTELIATLITPQSEEGQSQGWDKFDDYRLKNTFAANNIGSWFQSNLQSFASDKDADEIRKNIFGTTDSIFKIECRGVVGDLEKKIIFIVQQTPPAAGAQQTPQTSPATAAPFNIIYSQWID
jgi:type II secretory pathway component PulK